MADAKALDHLMKSVHEPFDMVKRGGLENYGCGAWCLRNVSIELTDEFTDECSDLLQTSGTDGCSLKRDCLLQAGPRQPRFVRMTAPRVADFELGVVQAVLFTDPDGFSAGTVMRSFFPVVPQFDGDPQTFGDDAAGFPPDVPRVMLTSRSGQWRCQVAPARVDVFWNRTNTGDVESLSSVLARAAAIIKTFQSRTQRAALRLATVVTRYAPNDSPGTTLAQHFCQERWQAQPLNRPESFELHAHKLYELKGFSVNSWVRAKSGHKRAGDTSSKIVLVEQDLNTPPRAVALSDDEVSAFFAVCPPELDHILGLYFPGDS